MNPYRQHVKKKKTIWDNPEYKRLCDEHWSCIKGHGHESKKATALMRKIKKLEREFRSGEAMKRSDEIRKAAIALFGDKKDGWVVDSAFAGFINGAQWADLNVDPIQREAWERLRKENERLKENQRMQDMRWAKKPWKKHDSL